MRDVRWSQSSVVVQAHTLQNQRVIAQPINIRRRHRDMGTGRHTGSYPGEDDIPIPDAIGKHHAIHGRV